MRTTLQIDDDVLESARQLAAAHGRALGAVISDLARQALRPPSPRRSGGLPVFDVAPDAPAITHEAVARARDDE